MIASPGFGASTSTTSARERKGRGTSSSHRCAYGHGAGRTRSEITNASAPIPPAAIASFRRSIAAEYRRSGEQGQVRLALAAQHRQVDLHAVDPARLREHPCLRLHHLRRQHAAAGARPGLGAYALEVAAQLLDSRDGPHPLDLDGDPPVVVV